MEREKEEPMIEAEGLMYSRVKHRFHRFHNVKVMVKMQNVGLGSMFKKDKCFFLKYV